MPESSLESILDMRSSIANTEAVADFAFAESGARELYWVIPTAAKLRAKKTYKAYKTLYFIRRGKELDLYVQL